MANWSDPAFGYNTFYGSINDLSKTHSAYDPVVEVADESKTAIAGSWTGEGSLALLATLQDFRNTIPAIQEVVESARVALVSYKESLATIHWASRDWITQVDTAQYALNQSDRPVWDVIGHAEDTAARAVNVYRLAEARGQLEILYRRRRDADHEVINALTAAIPASWAKQSAGFASAGVTQAVLLSAADSKKAMLDLVERMVAGDLSDENIAALDGLLSVWGNSQTTMSTVFSKIGGADLVKLIDQLGEEVSYSAGALGMVEDSDLAVLSLAQRIRSGLAVGAENWGQDFANGFMTDMLTGNAEYFEFRKNDQNIDASSYAARAQAVSFLFSDPHGTPMPESLAAGAASAIDELERIGGSGELVNYTPHDAGVGASVFSLMEFGFDGDVSFNDLPGRVFETLGLYPDSALEFITAEGRVDYWFGERDWAAADKFAGPGALWFGAAQAESADSALVASEIMWALDNNESFVSENLSEKGAAYLAGAISVDLPGMVEFATTNGAGELVGPSVREITLFGAGSVTDTPAVSVSVLSKMLGVVGAHEDGAIVIQDAASNWQNAYFAYGMTSPDGFVEAMRQSNTLQGVIDGSGMGEVLAAAERSDVRREEMIEGISSLIGTIPIPGASGAVVEGGIAIADYAQGLLLSLGQDKLTEMAIGGTSDYNAALLTTGMDETSMAHSREYANGANLYSFLQRDALPGPVNFSGIEAPPTQGIFETADSFVGRSNDWYSDNKSALDAAGKVALGNPYFELDIVLQPYTAQVGDSEGEMIK